MVGMWDKCQIEEAVRNSTSYRGVAAKLGTNHHLARRLIEAHDIEVGHFDFGRRSFSYVGKQYNRLTIQEVFKKDGRWVCRCACECGTKDVVKRLDGVRNGHIPSCGCACRSRPTIIGNKNPAFTGCGELSGSRVYEIEQSAKKRGIPYAVTREYLWELFELQHRKCALSGVPLVFGRKHSYETTASLDRRDSSKGYTPDNVQWVHKDVNKMKRDFWQDSFLEWCQLISDHTRQSQGL
jgi:hypothetical protein